MYTQQLSQTKAKKRRMWFLTGAIGSGLLLIFDTQFRYFYETVLGLNQTTFALIWTAFSIWNAINDPIFGFVSDRTKSRLGRRKPYILIGAIPFGLCFFFMFNPLINLHGASDTTIAIYAFFILFFYDGFYSLVYSNWMALIPETFRDQNELRRFNLVRLAINIVCAIIITLLIPILKTVGGGTNENPNMLWIGIIPAVLMPVCLLVSCIGIHENPVYQKSFHTPVFTSIKQAFQNRHFLGFVSYHSMYNIGKYLLTSNIAILCYYGIVSGNVFGMNFEGLMVPITFVTMVAVLPLWNLLFKKVTKDWTNVVCLCLCIVACLLLQFASGIVLGIIVAFVFGFAQSGYSLAHDLYNARYLDYHFAKTGQRMEGSYAGVSAAIDRILQMIGPWIIVIISAIGGYVAGTKPDDMTLAALNAVRSISGIGAAIFFTASAIISAFVFGLRGKTWLKIEAEAKAKDEELRIALGYEGDAAKEKISDGTINENSTLKDEVSKIDADAEDATGTKS